MIKALRTKFVAMMMSVVTLILLAIFLTMLITTQKDIERNSMMVLQQSLDDRVLSQISGMPPQTPGGPPPNSRMPTMVIEASEDGTYRVLLNRIYNIGESDLASIVALALSNEETFGTIKSHDLRYLRREINGTTLIAFADTSMETAILRNLVVTSLSIGAGALLAFFVLSILLARWAVGPVERAWESQRQFIADASHELRTPLTVILSNAEMLDSEDADKDDKQSERIENIKAEGLRMKRLIESMLSLARSDHAEAPFHLIPVCLSDIVMDSVLLFESTIYDEGKTFEYRVKDNIVVHGDPERLRQLVDILLENAIKYTPKGGLISVDLDDPSKKSVLLSVANEGQPIPADELDDIFQRFYRVDKSRQSDGGFGLGLSIAQNIVSAHKGKIWAESDPHKGNVFHVSLPVSPK